MRESDDARLDLDGFLGALMAPLRSRLGAALTPIAEWPLLPQENALRPAPGVSVRLGLGAGSDVGAPWLWLDSTLATNLVDRALGGRGDIGVAMSSAGPSEAECGVIAYLAARAVAPLPPLVVRDVSARGEALPADVVWPFCVELGDVRASAQVGLCAPFCDRRLACRIGWHERLSKEEASALQRGDVLVFDELVLSVTTQGLSGACVLEAEALHAVLPVLVDGGRLRAQERAQRRRPEADGVMLVAQDLSFSVRELAQLQAGDALSCNLPESANIALCRGAETLAEGVLVKLQGKLGFEVLARN